MKKNLFISMTIAAAATGLAGCEPEADEKSNACEIVTFTAGGVKWGINGTDITCAYQPEAVSNSLTPVITVSDGATVNPPSGAAQNFFTEEGVSYTVTAEDGTTQKTYTAKALTAVASGTTGEGTWALTGTAPNYTLTISGTGAMEDYEITYINNEEHTTSPWDTYREDIKTAVIQEGVTIIGDFAFAGCHGFTGSLTIPNSVTTIGDAAFSDCSGLTAISVDASNQNYSSSDGVLFNKDQTTLIQCPGGKTGSYTIPNSVTTIGYVAFGGCTGLTGSLTIPNSVTTIGNSAFYGCSGFTGSLTIPESVETIGRAAFAYCRGFTGSLTIGDSVKTIGEAAFRNCRGFTGALTIPESVETIGRAAFQGCTGFASVTIGNSVTTIGTEAFAVCSGLTTVTIGNSVKTIGGYAFYGCTGLTTVINLRITPQSMGSFTFTNINNITLKVPSIAVDTYKSAVVWRDFKEIKSIE
jgi:hypothetical protein